VAGHSQFKNIMHRKGAQDAKRAKLFTKILREVTVAVRSGGSDPETNHRLRNALIQARQANVPKDNLDRVMSKANQDTAHYESIYYEGFGPGQTAVLVHTLTDNRNRSASDVRTLFNKHGGRFADVGFLFSHVGIIVYQTSPEQREALMELAIEEGAVDIQESETECIIYSSRETFFTFRDTLESRFGVAHYSNLTWIPHTPHALKESDEASLEKFISALEDLDDVQSVWTSLPFVVPNQDQ